MGGKGLGEFGVRSDFTEGSAGGLEEGLARRMKG